MAQSETKDGGLGIILRGLVETFLDASDVYRTEKNRSGPDATEFVDWTFVLVGLGIG